MSGKLLVWAALLVFCPGQSFAASGAKDGARVWYKAVASNPPVYVLRLADNPVFLDVCGNIAGILKAVRESSGLASNGKIKFHVTGHGMATPVRYEFHNGQALASAAGADAVLVLDFPEFRSASIIAWPLASRQAARKTALTVAAINFSGQAEVWSMRGDSGMAENIVKMTEIAPELADFISVRTNVVLDSYPFSKAPFVPRKVSPELLKRIGGKMFVNYTKFGHWSNPLAGDSEKLVNVCVAPGGKAVDHVDYWGEATRQLLIMEIAGASSAEINSYVANLGSCGAK